MTGEMIAYCGLKCTSCPAYLATKAGDEKKAGETAELWTRLYNISVKVEDVWCDGCTAAGKKCAHCGECKMRACAIGKKVESCALCETFPCEEISGFMSMVPEARTTLERIKGRAP